MRLIKIFSHNQKTGKVEELSEEQFNTLLEGDYLFWCSGLDSWLKREEFKFEYQEMVNKRAEYLKQSQIQTILEEPKKLFKIR